MPTSRFSSWAKALFAPSFRTNFRKITLDLETLGYDAQHKPRAATSFQQLMARLDGIDERITKEMAAYKVKLIARSRLPEPELTRHLSTKDREWEECELWYCIAHELYIEVLDLILQQPWP